MSDPPTHWRCSGYFGIDDNLQGINIVRVVRSRAVHCAGLARSLTRQSVGAKGGAADPIGGIEHLAGDGIHVHFKILVVIRMNDKLPGESDVALFVRHIPKGKLDMDLVLHCNGVLSLEDSLSLWPILSRQDRQVGVRVQIKTQIGSSLTHGVFRRNRWSALLCAFF